MSPNSSSASLAVSAEASASQTAPATVVTAPAEPPLEKLVEYLVAAKRSLSSKECVWRANQIVTSVRDDILGAVRVHARVNFVQRILRSQLGFLLAFKTGVDRVGSAVNDEFERVLRDLDEADARLQKTLQQLRDTSVDPVFAENADAGTSRNLYDFVDEGGVEAVKATLRTSIDHTQDAQQVFDETARTFQKEIESLSAAVNLPGGKPPIDGISLGLAGILDSMNARATEMAGELESLVRHFDFCVTVIKQTEGGGAAAQQITGDVPDDLGIPRPTDPGRSVPDSAEERAEMFRVLRSDAAEVDDVVVEIRDGLASLEAQADRVAVEIRQISRSYSGVADAFAAMERLETRMPLFVQAKDEFSKRWNEEKESIAALMSELNELGDFYGKFVDAYDGLIIEVSRRQEVQATMDVILNDAIKQVELLSSQDAKAREAFQEQQGAFLPADIWPGLARPPTRFEIVATGGDSVVPQLDPKLVRRAQRRRDRRKARA